MAVFAFAVVVAQEKVTYNDFSGVWRSYIDISNINILTPEGPGVVCRDELSPECEAELTPIEDTYTFNGTTLALEARDRIGITTIEQSAAAHPECAKDGIYPVERIFVIPQSQIIFYNQKTESLYFIDPRRPDDINCLVARYRIAVNGLPYIEINHGETFQGSAQDVLEFGTSYRCELPPQPCLVEISETGELNLALQMTFNLTCIDGDCINIIGAMEPSSEGNPKESLTDG